MARRILTVGLLILALAGLPAGAALGAGVGGGSASVVALGQVPTGKDQAAARDRAVTQALTQAVGRLAAELVDPATLRTGLDKLSSQILANAPRYVTTYALQATSQVGDTTTVLVTVTIDREALLKELAVTGLRLPAGSLPLTLVMISEEASPGRPPAYWWSGAGAAPAYPAPVGEVLSSLGVRTVDPQTIASRVPEAARQPVVSEEQAMELARLAGAGLVLLGRMRTYPLITPKGEETTPLVQILAVDPVKASTLAMVEEEGPVYESTPPPEAADQVAAAVQKAVRSLLEQVVAQSPTIPEGETMVSLQVSGVESLGDLHRFEEVVGGLESLVDNMRRVSVAAGQATLELKLKVPAATLADQLLLQDYGRFLVNVVDVGAREIKVVLIPKR